MVTARSQRQDPGAMPLVRFTPNLRAVLPELEDGSAEGRDVRSVLEDLERRFPGLRSYVVDEHGALRPHVNIFVDSEPVQDRRQLLDPVPADACVSILQALSGG